MTFTVNTSKAQPGSDPLEFGDGDSFEVTQGGVLIIQRADNTKLYLNHTLWDTIEETSESVETSARLGSQDQITDGEFDASRAGF